MVKWVLIIGLLLLAIYAFVLLRGVWRSWLSLYHASIGFGEAFTTYVTPNLREYSRSQAAWEDPSRVQLARERRVRIKQVRDEARERRLAAARLRWQLARTADFERFAKPARTHTARYQSQHSGAHRNDRLAEGENLGRTPRENHGEE